MNTSNKRSLYEILKLVEQFRQQIQDIYIEVQKHSPEEVNISELPPSVIDTEIFLSILNGYTIMYNELLDHSLVKQGQPKYNHTIH